MRPDPVLLLLSRIFLCTSLAGTLAWVGYYFRLRGWDNPVGRNWLAVKLVIAGLLLDGLLASFFRFNPLVMRVLSWADVVLLAAIGPFMVWRMRMFRRLAALPDRCPAGHPVPVSARYCPQCGIALRLPARDGAPTPPEGISAAD